MKPEHEGTLESWVAPNGFRKQIHYTDAGRSASHHTKEKRDCTVRAVATCFDVPYSEAHERMAALGRKPKTGLTFKNVAQQLGGLDIRPDLCTRKLIDILPEMQKGRFIVRIARHVFAVIDGVIYDDHEPADNRYVRMVYERTAT